MLAVLPAALNLLRLCVDGDDKLTRRAVVEAGIATCAHRATTPVCFRRRRATVAFCWRKLRDRMVTRGLTYTSLVLDSSRCRRRIKLARVTGQTLWPILRCGTY